MIGAGGLLAGILSSISRGDAEVIRTYEELVEERRKRIMQLRRGRTDAERGREVERRDSE